MAVLNLSETVLWQYVVFFETVLWQYNDFVRQCNGRIMQVIDSVMTV